MTNTLEYEMIGWLNISSSHNKYMNMKYLVSATRATDRHRRHSYLIWNAFLNFGKNK